MLDPRGICIYNLFDFKNSVMKNHVKISQPTSGQVTGEIKTNTKRKKSKYSSIFNIFCNIPICWPAVDLSG